MSSPLLRTPAHPAPEGASRGFRTDIQGLRAVAVALVVLYHAGLPGLTGGFIGVDVFFVISGFLITGHLLASLRETGRIGFAGFYARRARRILPASFVVLALTVIGAFLLASPVRLTSILRDAIATALYVPNYSFAAQQTDYLAGTAPSPFQHFWSLGVEEQFYLLWPALLLVFFLLARRSAKRMAIAIAATVLLSFVACLVVTPSSQPWAFFSLPTRAWELGAGGLVAGAIPAATRLRPAIAAIGGWLGLAAVLAGGILFTPETPYPSFTAALPVLGAAVILWCGPAASGWGPARLLSLRPLQLLGLISYSLYLVHWPLLILLQEHAGLGTALPLTVTLSLALLSVLLAWALYRFVEAPMRDRSFLKRRRPRSTLVAALAASVALVVALLGAGPAVALLPSDSGREAPPTVIALSPSGTDFVPTNLQPALDHAVADTGELYTDGCQQSLGSAEVKSCSFGKLDSPFVMALFGDSHAGRWFNALKKVADGAGIRLETFTKSGCRSEETAALWDDSANASCSQWRAGVITRLHAHPPDLIVLTNHLGPTPGRDPATVEREWEAGIASTLARLPTASQVVTIADTPEFPASPEPCLSAHLNDAIACAGARSSVLNHSIDAAQRAVSAKTGAGYLNLDDYLCTATSCPPIIGNTLVYSDEHHLTATFSALLSAPLADALAPYLPKS